MVVDGLGEKKVPQEYTNCQKSGEGRTLEKIRISRTTRERGASKRD